MTAFRFRLERVLDLRRTQFQIAESECQRAAAKLRGIQVQQAVLAARKSETRKTFARLPEVAGRELLPLPVWYKWTDAERGRLAQMEHTAAQELEKKRQALIEAQKKVRLLEKLYERRWTEWQAEFDREIEEIAEDSTSSRYARKGERTSHIYAEATTDIAATPQIGIGEVKPI